MARSLCRPRNRFANVVGYANVSIGRINGINAIYGEVYCNETTRRPPRRVPGTRSRAGAERC